MSKAWAENISDESIVDRYLTYCFDLNHNTEKDAPMTYDVHSIAEKIRKDISPKTKYHVGTVITWQVRFGGKGPLYHYRRVDREKVVHNRPKFGADDGRTNG